MTGNATPESRTMTEPKEIKLFDLKTDKRYDITAISNGLFFILEGNLKLYLSVVDLFSDSTKINKLYELYDAVSYFLDKKQIVFLQRNHMIFNSSDCEDCFCNIIISEDLPI
jgi:hypothetical protein